jgi:hypothetical protein
MRIEKKDCLRIENLPLGHLQVGALRGGCFVINSQEITRIEKYIKNICRSILSPRQLSKITGFFRADLIPKFQDGNLSIKGIYEINGKAPECIAASAAWDYYFPDAIHPLITYKLAQQLKRLGKIYFLQGGGLLKKSWGDFLFNCLKKDGVDIKKINVSCLEKTKDGTLWIWGDLRENSNYNEFSKREEEIILSFIKKNNSYFNTIPQKGEVDLINKKNIPGNFLVSKNKERVLNNKNEWVLKPYDGASGKDILFGQLCDENRWKREVQQMNGHYVASPFHQLPIVKIPNLGEMVIDFNSAFWIEKGQIQYLYSLIRMDRAERYRKTLTINVAQGGGLAGIVKEEH